MKPLIAAFALASLAATSAWAKTETSTAVRAGALILKSERAVVRQPAQNYALILGTAF
jgi:hypothetical protein